MSAETPNPQPPREINRADVIDELSYRFKEADPNDAIAWVLDELADLDILRFRGPALCTAAEGTTGIRCQQPTGHVGGHKGTTTEEQTKAVGYPLFVSWPAESEPPARRLVRVPNEPHGLSHEDRVKIGAFLAAGHKVSATVIAMERGLSREDADAYIRDMPEYQTYLAARGEKREPREFAKDDPEPPQDVTLVHDYRADNHPLRFAYLGRRVPDRPDLWFWQNRAVHDEDEDTGGGGPWAQMTEHAAGPLREVL